MDQIMIEMKAERLLKAFEVAEILNISRAFAYQLMQQGSIPTVAIRGARRVRPADLRAFIENNIQPQAGEMYFR